MEVPESNRTGYAWLAAHFAVVTLPYWRESRALAKGVRRLVEKDGRQIEYLPAARDLILPVSAVILNRPREYDQALESVSKPLMELVEYTMDDRRRMTVTNDTADFYRYIDCTELTRITIDFIRETIETELPAELRYLASYDDVRLRMREVVELPDRIADLFVRLCRQNGGSLSKNKRGLEEFAPLTDGEIEALERLVREGLGIKGGTV